MGDTGVAPRPPALPLPWAHERLLWAPFQHQNLSIGPRGCHPREEAPHDHLSATPVLKDSKQLVLDSRLILTTPN